jgi:S-(hydroxymethyl)glutathione dehydrogenase/alcohol dehydrogenase
MMKTKAAILTQLNKPLVIDEIEIPSLKRGQVLVRILCAGLCRSQLNEIQGLKGPDPYLPHLLGHEGSGIVEAAGPGVGKARKGDRVVLSWMKGPGLEGGGVCYRKGKSVINAGAVCVFTQRAVVSENRLTRISRKLPPEIGALLGCAVPTGAGIVFNTLKVKKEDVLAVFGVGGIGAGAILAARMLGCRNIIAVDKNRAKLKFARGLGAAQGYCFSDRGAAALCRKLSAQGIDFALEASGARQAMELAFRVIRDDGTAVIAGNIPPDETIAINPFDLIKGKRIIGSWGGQTAVHRDIPFYARAYLDGRLPLRQLITHRFRFEQINSAFEILKKGGAGRIILDFPDSP